MLSILLLILSLNMGTILASPGASAVNKTCITFDTSVTVTSENFAWNFPFNNNFDVTEFNTALNRRDYQTSFNPFAGVASSTSTYNIAGTYCAPASGNYSTVLLASHGLSLDRK